MKLNITDVAKFNPYHDERGRYTTGSGETSLSIRTRDPNKQYMADRAVAREKERQAQSVSQTPAKRNDTFDSAYGKDRGDILQGIVDNCENEDMKRIWNEHFHEANVVKTESASFFRRMTGEVYLGQKHMHGDICHEPNETAFHEMAHFADFASSTDTGSRFERRMFSLTFENGAFLDTLNKEYKNIERDFKKRMETELGGKYPISTARVAMKKFFTWHENEAGYRVENDPKEWGAVWDIMQGCSKSKVTFPVGHPNKYYQGGRANQNLATEAFANMFSTALANPKGNAKIKEYFPESYKIFERMIGEM